MNRRKKKIIELQQQGKLGFYETLFKENEVKLILYQYANTIKFLHFNGVIHRDLKPENILLFENNLIKLNDFGWCFIDREMALEKNQQKNRKTFCGTDD